MPGALHKRNGYSVRWGGKTTAKSTTRRKAQAQLNLLRGIEHGWRPTGKPARKSRLTKRGRRAA